MADAQDPDEPTYGWLYGTAGPPPDSPDDAEPTQGPLRPPAASDDHAPEHTQILDVQRPEPTTPLATPADPPAADTPPPPKSFGGTYEAPPRR
ncbi:MAG: hypothetical protein WAK18_05680, partial [Nocardioidaceae bacterium]